MQPLQLSAHVSLAEFIRSDTSIAKGINNDLPPEYLPRAIATAAMIEKIRAALGNRPILISSGYRCEALNRAVGGQVNSDHLRGDASDITAPNFGEPYNVAKALEPLVNDLEIGQLILEGVGGKRWVHVSTHRPSLPINRILTITHAGAVPGIHPVV